MRDYDHEGKNLENKKYNYEFDNIVRSYMMKIFHPFFSDGPALEVGCYHGDSTIELEKFFENLTVIERSTDAIVNTKKRVRQNVQFHNDTLETFSGRNKFDSIFIINTLEHVDDAIDLMKQAKRLLSENGRLYMLVPNAHAPSRQIATYMGLIETNNSVTNAEYTHGHRRTYSYDTFANDLSQADVNIQQMGGILFKGLANYQMDLALEKGIISMEYIDACYKLGMVYPQLCSSIYCIGTHQS